MAVKAATKKRLMDNGVTESLAHFLADNRTIEEVKDLGIHDIAKKIYGLKITSLEDFIEMATRKNPPASIQKARIIYYLIDPENRTNPADNMPDTPPTFGIFNWWWGEDYEEPNRILRGM